MCCPESNGMLSLHLHLSAYEPARFQSFIDESYARGYRFSLLKDLLHTPHLPHSLYALVKEGVCSAPQSDGSFESFDAFCSQLLQPYYLDVADSFVIATFKDVWVGLTGMIMDETTGIAKSGLTVVQPAHQRRGVAKALKAYSLRQAIALGVKAVTTENHVDNAPMLAINATFGFVQKEGVSKVVE